MPCVLLKIWKLSVQAFRLAGFIFICKHAPRLYCQFSIILKGFDQKGYEVKMTFVSSSFFFVFLFLLFLFIYFRCSIDFYSFRVRVMYLKVIRYDLASDQHRLVSFRVSGISAVITKLNHYMTVTPHKLWSRHIENCIVISHWRN